MATLLGARPFFGTVMRIDRANRLVYWRPDGSSEDEEATFDGRRRWAPWPLARARFDVSTRTPHCEHPIGHRERIFRDHFTHVAAASGYGDGAWLKGDLISVGSIAAASGVGLGAAAITPARNPLVGTETYLQKSPSGLIVLTPPHALLVRLVVTPGDLTEGSPFLRLSSPGSGAYAWVRLTSPAQLFTRESSGVGENSIAEGTEVIAGISTELDLIVTGGIVALWVGANGPTQSTSNVPLAGDGVTLQAGASVIANASADRTDKIDAVTVERVTIAGVVP